MGLICVARYSDAIEAEVARSLLNAHGIDAVVFDSFVSQNVWYVNTAIGGVRLMVVEDRAAEALRLLAAPPPCNDEAEAIDTCPECGSDNVAKLYNFWRSLPFTMLTGIPCLLHRTRRHCRDCGHDWRAGSASQ